MHARRQTELGAKVFDKAEVAFVGSGQDQIDGLSQIVAKDPERVQQIGVVLVCPELRGVKNEWHVANLANEWIDAEIRRFVGADSRGRMTKHGDAVTRSLIVPAELLRADLGSGDHLRRPPQETSVTFLAVIPRPTRRHLRKPGVRQMLQIPHGCDVRYVQRFVSAAADEPYAI